MQGSLLSDFPAQPSVRSSERPLWSVTLPLTMPCTSQPPLCCGRFLDSKRHLAEKVWVLGRDWAQQPHAGEPGATRPQREQEAEGRSCPASEGRTALRHLHLTSCPEVKRAPLYRWRLLGLQPLVGGPGSHAAERLGTQRTWRPGREAGCAAARTEACFPRLRAHLSGDASPGPCVRALAILGTTRASRGWSCSDTCQPRGMSTLLLRLLLMESCDDR